MSINAAFARVATLEAMVKQAQAPLQPPPVAFQERSVSASSSTLAAPYIGTTDLYGTTTSSASGTVPPFISALQSALGGTAAGSSPGRAALQVAQGEVGVQEEPPGSNESPRIAEYRTATAGAYAGAPWCAYFVSWAASQAGAPIGDGGSGLGSVDGVAAWAGRTGRLLPPTAEPQPGDLILFGGRHMGIVESVNPDGTLTTVEGNNSDAVNRVTRQRSESTGWVRL